MVCTLKPIVARENVDSYHTSIKRLRLGVEARSFLVPTRGESMSELGFHSMSELRRVTQVIRSKSADELHDALNGIIRRIPDVLKRVDDPMFNAILRELERRRIGARD